MTAPACWMDNISLIGVIIFSYLPLKNSLFMEACMYPFANNKAVTCIVNPDYPTELPLSLEKPRMRRSSQPFAGSSRDILAAVRLVCSVRTVTSTPPCTASSSSSCNPRKQFGKVQGDRLHTAAGQTSWRLGAFHSPGTVAVQAYPGPWMPGETFS